MNVEITPFPRRPVPIRGETLYGFERRFASCTRFESLGSFRHAAGLHWMSPRSIKAKWERLAALSGQPVAAFEHMRWIEPEGATRWDIVTFLDHEIRAIHLRTEQLRFCPHCLAEGRGPERRIHRQAWQLSLVSACPRHRVLLAEACDQCGQPFKYSRKTKAWACACGREMTQIETQSAPEGAVAMSLAFMRRVGIGVAFGKILLDRTGILPPQFEKLGLDDLLSVSAKIGILATTSQAADKPVTARNKIYYGAPVEFDISVEAAACMMDAAYRIITNWPDAVRELFSELADRNPGSDVAHPVRATFATEMGYRLLGPLRSIDRQKIQLIDDALEEWLLEDRGIYLDGRRRAKVTADGDIFIDVADAMRRLEGRSRRVPDIKDWEVAGAVTVLGRKVLLSSVDQTVEAIACLPDGNFEHSMSVEDWSNSRPFGSTYRRSDALSDILSGQIRVKRDPGETRLGLAALRISTDDLENRSGRNLLPKERTKTKPKPVKIRLTRLQLRVARLEKTDAFMQPSRLNALITKLWPGQEKVDLTSPDVRSKRVVREYYGRDFVMSMFSVVDAMNVMTRRYGHFVGAAS